MKILIYSQYFWPEKFIVNDFALELVKKISQRTGIERQDVIAVIESMMINVKQFVAEGETIYLRGFGSFGPKRKAEKTNCSRYQHATSFRNHTSTKRTHKGILAINKNIQKLHHRNEGQSLEIKTNARTSMNNTTNLNIS